MLNIFLQYAGNEARDIGLMYRIYLIEKRFDAFLAGKGSEDIPIGSPDWITIEHELLKAHVIVAICTEDYEGSVGVNRELDILDKNNLKIPIVPLLKDKCRMPVRLKGLQRRRFDPLNYSKDFCDWTIDIYKQFHITAAMTEIELYKRLNSPRIKELMG